MLQYIIQNNIFHLNNYSCIQNPFLYINGRILVEKSHIHNSYSFYTKNYPNIEVHQHPKNQKAHSDYKVSENQNFKDFYYFSPKFSREQKGEADFTPFNNFIWNELEFNPFGNEFTYYNYDFPFYDFAIYDFNRDKEFWNNYPYYKNSFNKNIENKNFENKDPFSYYPKNYNLNYHQFNQKNPYDKYESNKTLKDKNNKDNFQSNDYHLNKNLEKKCIHDKYPYYIYPWYGYEKENYYAGDYPTNYYIWNKNISNKSNEQKYVSPNYSWNKNGEQKIA